MINEHNTAVNHFLFASNTDVREWHCAAGATNISTEETSVRQWQLNALTWVLVQLNTNLSYQSDLFAGTAPDVREIRFYCPLAFYVSRRLNAFTT